MKRRKKKRAACSATLGTGKGCPDLTPEERMPERTIAPTVRILEALRKRPGFVTLFAYGIEDAFGVACLAARDLNISPAETAANWDAILDRAIAICESEELKPTKKRRRSKQTAGYFGIIAGEP